MNTVVKESLLIEREKQRKRYFLFSLVPLALGITWLLFTFFAIRSTKESLHDLKQQENNTRIKIRNLNDSFNRLKMDYDSLVKNFLNVQESAWSHLDRTKSPINFLFDTLVYNANYNLSASLLKNSAEVLLSLSVVKVYYKDTMEAKALRIDKLLNSKGVKSVVGVPDYPLTNTENRIVYYNVTQINYCKAVQELLQKNNFGYFEIRPSSGQSATLNHFKIYVVK